MSYHTQENSAITDQSATRFDTGQRPGPDRVCSLCGNRIDQPCLHDDAVELGMKGMARPSQCLRNDEGEDDARPSR